MNNATTEQQYRVVPSIREQLPEVVAAAYIACDLAPPNEGAALLARINAEPTSVGLALVLAAEAVRADDAEAWHEDALSRIQRAQANDALRAAVDGNRSYAMKVNGRDLVQQATSGLSKPFAAQVKRLTTAAKELPAGDDPLDLEAVVEAHATVARSEARVALGILGAIASTLGTVPNGDVHPRVRDLLHVVDVPTVPLAHINRMTRETVNPDPTRDQLRRLARDVEQRGPDAALIAIARGNYGPDVVIRLASDRAVLRERVERMRVAISALAVETTDKRRPLKAPMPTAGY